jgi:hypothetical protein
MLSFKFVQQSNQPHPARVDAAQPSGSRGPSARFMSAQALHPHSGELSRYLNLSSGSLEELKHLLLSNYGFIAPSHHSGPKALLWKLCRGPGRGRLSSA